MWNNIFIMDYSIDAIKLLTHVSCNFLVSYSRLPKVMYINLFWREDSLELHSANSRNSSSKTMTSSNNTRTWKFFNQSRHFVSKKFFEDKIISIKPSMKFASLTSWICYLLEICVFNPILNIASSSKRKNNLIILCMITYISSSFCKRVLNIECVCHWYRFSCSACPWLNTFFIAKSDCR